jgi:hypothetical protein
MSDTCQSIAIFLLCFPLLLILNFSRQIKSKGWLWCSVAAISLYHVILFLVPLALGHLEILHPPTYRVVLFSLGGLLVIRGVFCLKPLLQAVLALRYRPRFVDLLILAGGYILFVNSSHQLIADYSIGPTEFDANNYHIPRAMIWSLHGNFAPWGSATWQQIGLSPGGTAALVPPVFMGCGFLGVGLTGTIISLGAGLGVALASTALGLSVRAATLGMLAFLSFPTIGFRFSAVNSDIAGAFPVIAGTALFLSTCDRAKAFFALISLCSLGVACKSYVASCAAPIVMLFMALNWRHIISSARLARAIALATATGAFFVLLSYLPVYRAFGDFHGGPFGADMSVFPHGYSAIVKALTYGFVHWLSEPISLLPTELQASWFTRLRFDVLYRWGDIIANQDFIPHFNRNESRSGVLPLVALPWLIFGVPRKYRLAAFLGFIALVSCQVASIRLNLTGRFVDVPLAAFALLWAARAQRHTLLVSICVLTAFFVNHRKLEAKGWIPRFSSIHYEVGRGECHELRTTVRDDIVLVMTRPLAVDSYIAGRDGRIKFDYVWCPPDGDWVKHLADLKQRYRWIMFSTHVSEWFPGPNYEVNIKYDCTRKPMTTNDLRSLLTAAGWRFAQKLECLHELWTAEPVE